MDKGSAYFCGLEITCLRQKKPAPVISALCSHRGSWESGRGHALPEVSFKSWKQPEDRAQHLLFLPQVLSPRPCVTSGASCQCCQAAGPAPSPWSTHLAGNSAGGAGGTCRETRPVCGTGACRGVGVLLSHSPSSARVWGGGTVAGLPLQGAEL